VDRLSLGRRRFFVAFARAVKIKRRNKIINPLESISSLPEPSISKLIDSRSDGVVQMLEPADEI
jgi:hypothetical protein